MQATAARWHAQHTQKGGARLTEVASQDWGQGHQGHACKQGRLGGTSKGGQSGVPQICRKWATHIALLVEVAGSRWRLLACWQVGSEGALGLVGQELRAAGATWCEPMPVPSPQGEVGAAAPSLPHAALVQVRQRAAAGRESRPVSRNPSGWESRNPTEVQRAGCCCMRLCVFANDAILTMHLIMCITAAGMTGAGVGRGRLTAERPGGAEHQKPPLTIE